MARHSKEHRVFHCYKITCLANGKAYIGIASNGIAARWRQHRHDAKKGAITPLHSAIRKYGHEQFKIEIIAESSTWDEICEIEILLIETHNSLTANGIGYNVATGGQGPYGVKRSEETKNKLRQYRIDPERREFLRQIAKQQMSDPTNREISRLGAQKMWEDPKLSENSRKALQEYWRREDAQALRSSNQKKIMENANAKENLRQKARAQMQNPQNRELSRNGALKQWSNQEFRNSRLGGNHPMAKAVLADGRHFESIEQAAKALGVTATCIRYRIKTGKVGYSRL